MSHPSPPPPSVAVLIPCLNEEAAIGRVISGFRSALPEATIYVYDNGSTDRTVEIAREAKALVYREPHRGKGNVVRRMFADVDADIFVLVDGDDTYDASASRGLIDLLLRERLDMVTGARVTHIKAAYRVGHRFGNVLLTSIVAGIFGARVQDMLSGYRVFSRRFVKSFPALSTGFEIETELTVHALELRMPIAEAPTPYRDRPAGSTSKLNTLRDGVRILFTILELVKEERPLRLFGALFGGLALLAVGLSIPLLVTYERTGLVPRFPTAILATGLMLLSFLNLFTGLILDSVCRGNRERKRLHYLTIPALPTSPGDPAVGHGMG